MPAFFNGAQIRDALRNQAFPAVEALAANESLRQQSLRRFERDDPPPYASSTDSSEFDPTLPQLSLDLPLSEEIEALLDPPLTDREQCMLACGLDKALHPSNVYYRDCRFEAERLDRYRFRHKSLHGEIGIKRFGVLVRRNVKRRWQKLGIWNPAWGFPGRNAELNDNTNTWNWWWRQPGYFSLLDGKQLVDRAVLLRQNLRRGESVPVLPRSRLQQDTPASQADSFLISRPWFLWMLEWREEYDRCMRIPNIKLQQCNEMVKKHVGAWWRDRGEYRDDFSTRDGALAWKWRHESPSPEPEPLAPFEPTGNAEYNPIETIELTPSEIDALETIELPSSEWPDKFWAIYPGDEPPYFPGQLAGTPRPPSPPPSAPRAPLPSWPPRFTLPLFRSPSQEPREHVELPPLDLQEATSEPQRDTCRLPPRRPRRSGVSRPTARVPISPLPPRCSARIAAMKRPAEPLPAQAAPSKKPKTRATAKAPLSPRYSARTAAMKRPAEPLPAQAAPHKKPKTRATAKAPATTVAPRTTAQETRRTKSKSVPARPPAGREAETQLRRGRGRPRRGAGPGVSSPVTKKPAGRTTISGRTRSHCERGP